MTSTQTPGDQRRNVWEQQYKDRTAADMAAQFESERRPVYRHRRDIVALLVIVDFPRGRGRGVDRGSVIETAEAAGLTFVDRSGVVPSHFALRFRKR